VGVTSIRKQHCDYAAKCGAEALTVCPVHSSSVINFWVNTIVQKIFTVAQQVESKVRTVRYLSHPGLSVSTSCDVALQ
jgi:predicted xylose isomerase-like sugar epimerase